MGDTDILLSVDLDTKDALQTAKELGKEVEKSINSQTGKEVSVQMSSFNSQLISLIFSFLPVPARKPYIKMVKKPTFLIGLTISTFIGV